MPTSHLEFRSSLDDSAFHRSLRSMESGADKAADAISAKWDAVQNSFHAFGAIAGTAAFSLKSLVDFASDIGDSAEAINLNVEAFQGYVGVLEKGGVTQEKFELGMVSLTKKMEDAKAGSIEAVDTFEKLGISWKEITDLSPEEMLLAVASGLSEAKNETEAFDAATDILGKRSAKLVGQLKENGDALQEYAADVAKLSKEQQKELDSWGDKWTEWGRNIKVAISKAVADTAGGVREIAEAVGFRIGSGGLVQGLDDATKPQPEEFKIPGLNAPLEADGGGTADPRTKKAWDELDKGLDELNRDNDRWRQEVQKGLDKVAEFDAKISKEIREVDERVKLNRIEELRGQAAGLQEGIGRQLDAETNFNLMTADERRQAMRDAGRSKRARSRAERELEAARDPSRQFRDARHGEGLGGDLIQAAIDEKSIQKIIQGISQLIVAP